VSRLARSRENWLAISAALAMVSCSSCWALPPSRLSLVVSEATAAGPTAVAEDEGEYGGHCLVGLCPGKPAAS
jgi:hypothetical protein